MMPDEIAKLKQDILDVITQYGEDAGVDFSRPEIVRQHLKPMWIALEESGKLHPLMSYTAFVQQFEIRCLWAKAEHCFYGIFA